MRTSESIKTTKTQNFLKHLKLILWFIDTIKSYEPYKESKVITVVLLIRAKLPAEDFSVKYFKFQCNKISVT